MSYLICDCGSTATKAVLIGRAGGRWRLLGRAQAPTTVEEPWADVTRGVRDACAALGDAGASPALPPDLAGEADAAAGAAAGPVFLATSSAGGGLRMLVLGVVRKLTARSAERAALGAGAIVADVIAHGDGRPFAELVERVRSLRPDIVLLAGGTDGGGREQVLHLAELIAAAAPRPRWAPTAPLPVVFAGNREAAGDVARQLDDRFALEVVANVRPTLEREDLAPARRRLHAVFLEHVMSRAPGYDRLLRSCAAPVLPTPAAVGRMIRHLARQREGGILAVDVGGATTDVFSAGDGAWGRTVSANLGLSYSIGNVCREAGWERIAAWLPLPVAAGELRDRVLNKMIRPTTVPQDDVGLAVEHAVAREAIRLAVAQHRRFAPELAAEATGAGEPFRAAPAADVLPMAGIDLVIGSGGLLANAPRRPLAALVLLDACEPEGLTELAVDSVFMLPHLGVLATIDPEAAAEVLLADCLLPLGACLAARGRHRRGRELAECRLEADGAGATTAALVAGRLLRLPLPAGAEATLEVRPRRGIDCGAGRGRPLRRRIRGGPAGLLLDGRGRPLPPSGGGDEAGLTGPDAALRPGAAA